MTTGAGELEELERFVRTGAERLGRTQYLSAGGARELLEEIAHRRVLVSPSVTMTVLAAKSARPVWPPGLDEAGRREVVAGLFGESGILVPDGGDFRFSRAGAMEYLAACRIVRRHPRGPGRWDPRTRRYLAPHPAWPSAGGELDVFLAALWWPGARAAVERRLGRLLGERHRDPNIRLVLELLRRDLLPGNDFRSRTAAVLRQVLTDGQAAEQYWVHAAGWLHELDPGAAVALLDSFVRTPPPALPDRRKLFATVELAKHEPDRGRQNLKLLAANLTGAPQTRLATARLIRGHDPALGDWAMRQLAHSPGLRDLRVDAAIATGSPGLMGELVEHEDTLSDEARLRLAAELLERDAAAGIAAARRFAATAAPSTGLRIAELLEPCDRPAARQVAEAIAWTDGGDSDARLRAVRLIAGYEPAQAIPALRRLSADPSVAGSVRIRAAELVVTGHSGPITALAELAEDPDLAWRHRATAAAAAGETDAVAGARLLIAVSEADPPADTARLDLLKKAHGLAPGPAAKALAELAGTRRVAGPVRVEAVDLIGPDLGTARCTALYAEIAGSADEGTAMDAARKVLAADRAAGQRLMADLAGRKGTSFAYRLAAAQQGGSAAAAALRDLAITARPDALRLQAAKTLAEFDRSSAKPALTRLVRQGRPGEVRVAAALCLPGRSAVEALITIATDHREDDAIRLEAAATAKTLDRQRGRQALEDLAEDPRVSPAVRETAGKQAKK